MKYLSSLIKFLFLYHLLKEFSVILWIVGETWNTFRISTRLDFSVVFEFTSFLFRLFHINSSEYTSFSCRLLIMLAISSFSFCFLKGISFACLSVEIFFFRSLPTSLLVCSSLTSISFNFDFLDANRKYCETIKCCQSIMKIPMQYINLFCKFTAINITDITNFNGNWDWGTFIQTWLLYCCHG